MNKTPKRRSGLFEKKLHNAKETAGINKFEFCGDNCKLDSSASLALVTPHIPEHTCTERRDQSGPHLSIIDQSACRSIQSVVYTCNGRYWCCPSPSPPSRSFSSQPRSLLTHAIFCANFLVTLADPRGPWGHAPTPPRFFQNHAVFRQFSGKNPYFE